MGTPYLGEVKICSFNFAPKGWAMCNGQFLPINQNQALFSLFGTMYGGNGQTTFALPDMRGRVPIHFGAGHILGERGGSETVTITAQTMPAHMHWQGAQTESVLPDAGPQDPTGKVFAASTVALQGGNQAAVRRYSKQAKSLVAMDTRAVSNTGGSQAHPNMQPYGVLNYVVALQGVFPSQN
jgi:microcystin-dependent protein